ncbi:hypothetical protein HYN59_06780 [Flavobacterium album]|uniref:Uncharacterized protein n=1 Tax=Flavobacterium album TaxID=2175091 RepID=A0A2S1QWR6_9FLAO|nr:hypothetical protein HYN59_06780 [Flavobacterium album]
MSVALREGQKRHPRSLPAGKGRLAEGYSGWPNAAACGSGTPKLIPPENVKVYLNLLFMLLLSFIYSKKIT